MIIDDDKPDYFLASDTETEETDPVTEQAPAAGNTIDFGAGHTVNDCAGSVKPRRRGHKWLWIAALVCVATLAGVFYLRYCSPYVTDARMRAYIINVDKRGLLFKTYEAEVVSESALADTARVYSREHQMSVTDAALARRLQAVQGTGRPVTLLYERYYGTLPWRGGSKYVVTGVE